MNTATQSVEKQNVPAFPKVVIIGGGFGGLETAKQLKRSKADVTLVDRHNYHLFQPLLYQVATGGLSPANIAAPLRSILRKQRNCETVMAEVVGFDLAERRVLLEDGEIAYDYLVVAAGATHSYFGRDEWSTFAPGLKTIDDATYIRRRIYLAFEAAERESDPVRRAELMTFVVVGGGPTGVELAGAIAEIAAYTLRYDFRRIDPEDTRVILIEAGPHVLSHYPAELCNKAEAMIRSLHIEVHTSTKVTNIQEDHVEVSGPDGATRRIPTQTVLWGAGVAASPLGKKLTDASGGQPDRAGRVPVDAQLNLPGYQEVFVIGDLAAAKDANNKPLPGLASVAIQQGKFVAHTISQLMQSKEATAPFKYYDRGTMATIGRARAVAQIGKRQFSGFFAWFLWLFVHLLLIVQFQNRVLVFIQWGWNYITFSRSARLITGHPKFRPGR